MVTKLRDIAAELGLHESTVSRALANSPRVKGATRREVQRLSKQLDYRPNAIARSFALRRTHTIGLTIGSIIDPFFAAVIEALERHIREKNYDAILNLTETQQAISTRGHPRSIDRSIEMLRVKRIDGLVVWSTVEKEAQENLDKLAKTGLPFVVMGCQADDPVDFVAIDRGKGGYLVAEHLIKMGHKKIAYVGGDIDSSMLGRTKLDGYKQALEVHGIRFDPELVIECQDALAQSYDVGRTLAASRERCTAVFAYGDTVALGVLRGIKQAGLRVPQDIAIAGFNGTEQTAFAEVPLTTVSVPVERMAHLAIDILTRKIEGKSKDVQQVILDPELVVRASSCKTASER